MTNLLDQIRHRFPRGIREALLGNYRQDLFDSVTDTLVLFGDELMHVNEGRKYRIATDSPDGLSPKPSALKEESEGAGQLPLGEIDAEAIAFAAKQLLVGSELEPSILLLLAPSEFLATEQYMPGLTGSNLISAITLQQENILPACDETLALAVSDGGSNGHRLAMWIREARLTALFQAFSSHGLTLAALAPRTLAAMTPGQDTLLLDDDGRDTIFISARGRVPEQWSQIQNTELAEPAFSEQWQQHLAAFEAETKRTLTATQDFVLGKTADIEPSYGFFPSGALDVSRQRVLRKQLKIAAGLFLCLLGLAAFPFLVQTFELRMANARLELNRELSVDARQDQKVVVEFENRWGAIYDFPQQNVAVAMFRLQEVLGGEQLSSLELSEGLIRIQGNSSDPQAILQRLEQDPMFAEVVFSRATSNTRYFIDLRLATVNFDAYRVRHFQDEA